MGLVTDSEFRPLSDASVRLDEDAAHLTTDEAGHFRFQEVALGEHTVVANKTGYTDARLQLTVAADESVNARLQLAILPSLKPYVDTFPDSAFMSLGASTVLYTIRPGTYLSDTLSFHHNVTVGARTIVSALTWTSTAPLTAKLMRLDLILNGDLYNQTAGKSPLTNRVKEIHADRAYQLDAEVWLPHTCDSNTPGTCVGNPPDSVAVVVAQQHFSLYTSVFYRAPADPAFNGVPTS